MDGAAEGRGWDVLFDSARHQYSETLESELQKDLALRKRTRVSKSKASLVNEGHGLRRFKNFATLLEAGFYWGRHHFERKFHDECLKALAETLFGDEWHTYGMETVRERKWEIPSKMVIGSAPRRFGKSVSLSKVEAALAYSLLIDTHGLNFTEYNITNFSTGKRASQLLSQYVRKFLKELGLYEECHVETDNSEEIILINNGMRVIFKFLPSNPDTYVFFPFPKFFCSLLPVACVCVFLCRSRVSRFHSFSSSFFSRATFATMSGSYAQEAGKFFKSLQNGFETVEVDVDKLGDAPPPPSHDFDSELPNMADWDVLLEFTNMAMALKREVVSFQGVVGKLIEFFDDYELDLEERVDTKIVALSFNDQLKTLTVSHEEPAPFLVSGILSFRIDGMWCQGENILGAVINVKEGGTKTVDSQTFFREDHMVPAEQGFLLVSNPIPNSTSLDVFCNSVFKKWNRVEVPQTEGDDNVGTGVFVQRDLPFACLLVHFMVHTPSRQAEVVEVLTQHFGSQFVLNSDLLSALLEHHAHHTQSLDLHTFQLELQGVWVPGASSGNLSSVKASLSVTHVI